MNNSAVSFVQPYKLNSIFLTCLLVETIDKEITRYALDLFTSDYFLCILSLFTKNVHNFFGVRFGIYIIPH